MLQVLFPVMILRSLDAIGLQEIRGVMFYIDWRFTLLSLSIAPALGAVVFFYTKRIKHASRAVRKQESELLSGVAVRPSACAAAGRLKFLR